MAWGATGAGDLTAGANPRIPDPGYAGGSKLYVPVSSLHLISRYAGNDTEHAPLHKLGTDRWSNAKQKALEKIRDTAAELLDVYARREARKGFSFEDPKEAYRAFAAGFPFEETPDQQVAIQSVFEDMTSGDRWTAWYAAMWASARPRSPCAAFMATWSGKRVAVLVPPPCWPNSTTNRSGIASPIPRYRSSC